MIKAELIKYCITLFFGLGLKIKLGGKNGY